jgi:hypothetical protein
MGFCPREWRPVAADPKAGVACDLTTNHFH